MDGPISKFQEALVLTPFAPSAWWADMLLDIAGQNLTHASQTFFSSRHFVEGNRGRPDEALHLDGNVQFAGFRSVLRTLWAVDGEDGPVVAKT